MRGPSSPGPARSPEDAIRDRKRRKARGRRGTARPTPAPRGRTRCRLPNLPLPPAPQSLAVPACSGSGHRGDRLTDSASLRRQFPLGHLAVVLGFRLVHQSAPAQPSRPRDPWPPPRRLLGVTRPGRCTADDRANRRSRPASHRLARRAVADRRRLPRYIGNAPRPRHPLRWAKEAGEVRDRGKGEQQRPGLHDRPAAERHPASSGRARSCAPAGGRCRSSGSTVSRSTRSR